MVAASSCSVAIYACIVTAFAQREPDKVYMNNIHTPQLFLSGNQYGYPIIPLGEIGALELHFDDFDNDVKTYYYTYQLCNADWKPVDLSTFDYIDGFSQNRLTQYRQSSIALTKYIHYQAMLPEKSMLTQKKRQLLAESVSEWRYLEAGIYRRLLIVDNQVPVAAQIMQPFNAALFKTHQKVQFSIDKTKLNILNPAATGKGSGVAKLPVGQCGNRCATGFYHGKMCMNTMAREILCSRQEKNTAGSICAASATAERPNKIHQP